MTRAVAWPEVAIRAAAEHAELALASTSGAELGYDEAGTERLVVRVLDVHLHCLLDVARQKLAAPPAAEADLAALQAQYEEMRAAADQWHQAFRAVRRAAQMDTVYLPGDDPGSAVRTQWRPGDPEPPSPFPHVEDRYGISWVADERSDGFAGWRTASHGLRLWESWDRLLVERGPVTASSDVDRG